MQVEHRAAWVFGGAAALLSVAAVVLARRASAQPPKRAQLPSAAPLTVTTPPNASSAEQGPVVKTPYVSSHLLPLWPYSGAAMPFTPGGTWQRMAPDPSGLYSCPPDAWYCACIEWSKGTTAKDATIDPQQVASAFVVARQWLPGSCHLWSDPSRAEALGQMVLPESIPITRELVPGRIWFLGVPGAVETLQHARVVELWRRSFNQV